MSQRHRDAKAAGKNPAPQKPRTVPAKGQRLQHVKESSSVKEAMQHGALMASLSEGQWLHHVSTDKPNPKGAFLRLDADQGEQYLQRFAVHKYPEPLLLVADFVPTAEMERYMSSTAFFLPVERNGRTTDVQAVYWPVGENLLTLPEQPPKADISTILAETVNLTMSIQHRYCAAEMWREAYVAFQASKAAFRDFSQTLLKKKTEPLSTTAKTSTILDVRRPRLYGKGDARHSQFSLRLPTTMSGMCGSTPVWTGFSLSMHISGMRTPSPRSVRNTR